MLQHACDRRSIRAATTCRPLRTPVRRTTRPQPRPPASPDPELSDVSVPADSCGGGALLRERARKGALLICEPHADRVGVALDRRRAPPRSATRNLQRSTCSTQHATHATHKMHHATRTMQYAPCTICIMQHVTCKNATCKRQHEMSDVHCRCGPPLSEHTLQHRFSRRARSRCRVAGPRWQGRAQPRCMRHGAGACNRGEPFPRHAEHSLPGASAPPMRAGLGLGK